MKQIIELGINAKRTIGSMAADSYAYIKVFGSVPFYPAMVQTGVQFSGNDLFLSRPVEQQAAEMTFNGSSNTFNFTCANAGWVKYINAYLLRKDLKIKWISCSDVCLTNNERNVDVVVMGKEGFRTTKINPVFRRNTDSRYYWYMDAAMNNDNILMLQFNENAQAEVEYDFQICIETEDNIGFYNREEDEDFFGINAPVVSGYIVTLDANTTATANGEPVSSGDEVAYGTELTLTAAQITGKTFQEFTVDGVAIVGNSYTVESNVSIAAVYEDVMCTVTLDANTTATANGEPVSSGDEVAYGTVLTLTAAQVTGKTFENFAVNGTDIQGNTYTVTDNVSVVSIYADEQFDGLTLTARNGGVTVRLENIVADQVAYSDDDETWAVINSSRFSIELANGSHVSFKSNVARRYVESMPDIDDPSTFTHFTFVEGTPPLSKANAKSGSSCIEVSGNVMSLNYADYKNRSSVRSGEFFGLFYNCGMLIGTPVLPATTLDNHCYGYMFAGCFRMTTPPALPATTLGAGCYEYMFADCEALATAPNLPAVDIKLRCYEGMFIACSSLETAPALPATGRMFASCYAFMFSDCSSLTTAPALPSMNLNVNCYEGMFAGCTALVAAPALPATTLTESCYDTMFSRCRSLTQAPALPATTLANCCYEDMFGDCNSLVTAPALPATTLAESCYGGMFNRCTALAAAPALPATTLANYCYEGMFWGCESLVTAPALPATTLANRCYANMFSDCSSLTTAPALPATTLAVGCYESMFNNSGLTEIRFENNVNITINEGRYMLPSNSGTLYKVEGATIDSSIIQGWTVVILRSITMDSTCRGYVDSEELAAGSTNLVADGATIRLYPSTGDPYQYFTYQAVGQSTYTPITDGSGYSSYYTVSQQVTLFCVYVS